jgi:hypothetical protein
LALHVKSRLTGAPTRRLRSPAPRFFSPPGRSGHSAGGVATGTPGTIGTASRRADVPGGPRPARAPLPPHVIQAVQTAPPRGKGWQQYKGAWEGVDEKVGNFFSEGLTG